MSEPAILTMPRLAQARNLVMATLWADWLRAAGIAKRRSGASIARMSLFRSLSPRDPCNKVNGSQKKCWFQSEDQHRKFVNNWRVKTRPGRTHWTAHESRLNRQSGTRFGDACAFEELIAEPGFAVADSGIGVAQDKLGLLFQKFPQVDNSTTRNYGGSGLGRPGYCYHPEL